MFTIKLYRGHSSRYVQADSVQVFPAGPAKKMADDPAKRTNDVREIALSGTSGSSVYYVSKTFCWAHEAPNNGFDVYDRAYIENDRGATTEIVSPY